MVLVLIAGNIMTYKREDFEQAMINDGYVKCNNLATKDDRVINFVWVHSKTMLFWEDRHALSYFVETGSSPVPF